MDGGGVAVTAEGFRALARSSPWRWSTARLLLTSTGHLWGTGVRVHVRRPDVLRAEWLDGRGIDVIREPPVRPVLLTADGRGAAAAPPVDPPADGDGLVHHPRDARSRTGHDAPMLSTYQFVALLDPVELADGIGEEPGATVEDVRLVDHHGRPALEAVLRPTGAYDPRCSCCALLWSEVSDRAADGFTAPEAGAAGGFPDAHRVRLDVGTGICVLLEQLGGSRSGERVDVVVEAVDEPMPDALFEEPAATRLARESWADATWMNPPVRVQPDGAHLLVEAAEGSDLWRTTAYGFVHDSGHALLRPFPDDSAVEVRWELDYDQQFDQAGVLVRVDAERWIKAGVEVSDGVPQVGAVVTDGRSDWSVAPVPAWAGREVAVRASRSGGALTIRARVEDEPWQLVRVAPLPEGGALQVGPYCCAPTRAGLVVRFTDARVTPPDEALHP